MYRFRIALSIAAAGAAAAVPSAASAAPAAPHGYTLTTFATAPGNAVGPDDITYLDGQVFVAWQNGVGTKGEPLGGTPNSTLAEYSRSGQTLQTWSLTGKIDGLGADPRTGHVIATVNEDGNSSLYTINPSGRTGGRVIHYTYSPAPDSATSGGVFTGGGTDAVSVFHGTIVVSASNPTPPNATAAFRVRLDRRARVARLYPTVADNSPATDAATGQPVTLALTDPDSNAIVPGSSPRFGGDFVLDSQGDQQLVFTHHLSGHQPRLERLALKQGGTPAGVDDIRWADRNGGTLYIADNQANTIYALTGPLQAGEAFAALDTVGSASKTTELDTINLYNGELTTLVAGFTAIKGLVWAHSRTGSNHPENGPGNRGRHGHGDGRSGHHHHG